jgi:hypothetical protein
MNPIRGDMRRDLITSCILCQLGTTLKAELIGRRVIAIVTHMIDPISEWELDAGIPKYQVPAFQRIAEMRSDNTTHTPKEVFCSAMTSSGSRCMIAIATLIPQSTTPKKFMIPERMTAFWGSSDFV